MRKWIVKAVYFVWNLIKEEWAEQFSEINSRLDKMDKRFDELEQTVQSRHVHDKEALECDLASLDDQIGQQIERCRMRGYTTQSERRRVRRMHEAYRARGGNHGEEDEYGIFKKLPTEEEFMRNAQ